MSVFCEFERIANLVIRCFRRYLDPQESTIVTLYIDESDGPYEDQITFSAASQFQIVQKKVMLDVGLTQTLDMSAPEIEYSYKSDCTEILPFDCNKGSWTLEITAKDADSGKNNKTCFELMPLIKLTINGKLSVTSVLYSRIVTNKY